MTSLLNTNPDLSKDWHPTKNAPLTPKDVAPNSNKKVWWVCGKDHGWEARIYSRNQGAGCPYCSGQMVCNDNCLATLNPGLAKEWHPTKNASLTPRDVTSGSGQKVWWVCGKGHEWEATVNHRNRGRGCPYCSGRLATKEKNLLVNNPGLAKEWHPTKNAPLTPKDVAPQSNKKVWWACGRGHEWEAAVNNRNQGKGVRIVPHQALSWSLEYIQK